jgi:hypothetical protein
MVVSGGVPTIRRVLIEPAHDDEPLRAGITLAPGDGTVPLRSQTLTASDGGAIPGTHPQLATVELCASEHGGEMGDPALYLLIGPWLRAGAEPPGSVPCRAQRRVVFDTVDADFAPAPPLGDAAGPMAVADAEKAGLVEVLRFGRQALVLADPGRPIELTMAPQPGRTLRVTVRDVDGESSAVTVPETRTSTALTVAVSGGTGSIVTPGPPPPAPPPQPQPPVVITDPISAFDHSGPKVTVKVKRAGKRFRVTIRAKDPAGVRAISFRVGTKGRFKRYRKPLKLSRRDVKRLRIRAEDKLGNRSKLVRAKLPRRR